MDQKVRFAVAAVLALALVAGLSLLRRPTPTTKVGPGGRDGERDRIARMRHGAGASSVSADADKKPKKTTPLDRMTSDKLYGLPPLSMENVDINHEKPADMPLADWEEYERQRYEMVQLKAYKFRQTDPAKVVAFEISKGVPDAAKKYNVPKELLAALLYASSDGGHHDAQHDIEGGYGVMMLKESPQCDSLGEAAQILGVSKEDLIYNQQLNIEGGAAVLRQYYDDALATGVSESEAWYMAVAQYSGRPQPELARALADGVADIMSHGFESDSDDGSGYYKQDPMTDPIFQSKRSQPFHPRATPSPGQASATPATN